MYLFLTCDGIGPLKSKSSLSNGVVTFIKCISWGLLKRGLSSTRTEQEVVIFLIYSIENGKFRLLIQ